MRDYENRTASFNQAAKLAPGGRRDEREWTKMEMKVCRGREETHT
jgi:hypothetical protein